MASDASESASKQRISNRGKNYSADEDKQICLSWIHASDICDRTDSKDIHIYGTLYDHAVAKEPDIGARSAGSIRSRFCCIQREVRKFSDIYNQLASEETEPSESVLQNALRAYKMKHKTNFKYLPCWNILRGHPKFLQMVEVSSNVVETSVENDVVESPPKIDKTTSSATKVTRNHLRGVNILGDEIQALLKACRDLGVEEERSKGERIEPLMYDIQQQMANYGKFPERKLYLLKQHYFRTEKNYRNGFLSPYPPEARVLWGSNGTDKDDDSNDACWNKQIQYIVDHRRGMSFLSDLEIQELLNQALKRTVESVPTDKRKSIFHDILSSMHHKQLCRRKSAEQLMQDYLRLKIQFSTGASKYLPPETTKLWTSVEADENLIEEKLIPQPAKPDPLLQISFADCTTKSEIVDLCHICREEVTDHVKDLFLDVFNSETYAAIIKNVLNVEMIKDGLESTMICGTCSSFIENLVKFVQQCRESCTINESCPEHLTFEKEEIMEFDVSMRFSTDPKDDSKNVFSAEYVNDEGDYLMDDAIVLNEGGEATNDIASDANEDTDEKVFDENARKNWNYRKYLESRKSQSSSKRTPDSKNVIVADSINDESDYLIDYANESNEDDEATIDKTGDPNKDTIEEALYENARKQRNYRQYLESRKSTSLSKRPPDTKNLIPAESLRDEGDYLLDYDNESNEDGEATNDMASAPKEDTVEEVLDEGARKQKNYRKYLESRGRNRKSKRPPWKQCHLCGKKVRDLANHLDSHSGKAFKCQLCDLVCPNPRQLRIHMNRHTKKRAFPCRYCDRVFYVWSSRKNHEDTHTESVHKCDFCDMVYRHKSYLQKHRKAIHLGIRDLKCSECTFTTYVKQRLLNHVRSMHTSERPYKCPACEHTSNNSTGYYIHFQRHIKSGEMVDLSIECAYCKEPFTKNGALEAHVVNVHPDRAVII